MSKQSTEITTIAELRAHYSAPNERGRKKQLDYLDVHCQRLIGLSPYCVIASSNTVGSLDASPRGGSPGFVKCQDQHTLLIPDWPGNNRLDTLENILSQNTIGLLFLIPGMDEVVRVNGSATLSLDETLRSRCPENNRQPKLVIVVDVKEAYLHCGKSAMRSGIWDVASQINRNDLPSMGQMIKDQIHSEGEPESQAAMIERYKQILY